MNKGRRYRALTVELGASESRKIALRGSYVRVINADAEFAIGIDDDDPSYFAQGLGFELPDGDLFTELRLTETQGAPNSIVLGIGVGKMQDSRASFAQVLDVRDPGAGQESFADVIAKLDALAVDDASKRAALGTLAGATNANGTGTATIVGAGANVNGLIVRHACVMAAASGSASMAAGAAAPANINDSALLIVRDGGSAWLPAPLFVPAGLGLFTYVGAAGAAWAVWYEVL